MKLWSILSLFVISLGCTTGTGSLAQNLPERIGTEWIRAEVASIPPEAAPALVRDLGLEESAHVIYSGPEKVGVRVFRMRAAASAFELIQKWRQTEGYATYSGSYFLVADQDSTPANSQALLQGLQKSLSR